MAATTRGIKYVGTLPPGGYAEAAKRAVLGLNRAGVPVMFQPLVAGPGLGLTLEPYRGRSIADPQLAPLCNRPIEYDTVILHAPPELFPPLAAAERGKRIIGSTVWETDRLPPKWLPWLDAVERVVVPCQWNREVFAASGIRRPVHVVPHICEADAAEEVAPLDLDPEGRFVFYSIGDWSSRKGMDRLVRAYLAAFNAKDPVLLAIKTTSQDLTWLTPVGSPWPARWSMEWLRWRSGSRAPIRLLTGSFSERQLRALHARGDCYASLPNGEGWGLGMFDAAAAGKPVVTTGFGGPLDYLGKDYPFLVNHRLGPAQARVRSSAPAATSRSAARSWVTSRA